MSTHERTLAMIEAFYDAALDETLWPAVLENLAKVTRSQAATFWVLGPSGQARHPTFIYINFDSNSVREYLNGMVQLDPTVRYLFANPQQSIVHDGLLKDGRDKDTRDYYDWHRRNVETRFRMVGQAHLAPTVQAGVALHRTQKTGPYEPQDIERFGMLHRHLRRALSIGFRLGSLGAMQQFSSEWLDGNSAAVVLVDEHMRIVFTNRRAQALQSSGDGVRFSTNGIELGHRQDNEKLQVLLHQALSAGASPGGIMRGTRPSGKRPYGIFVTRVSGRLSALSLFRPAVCVVITDPDRQDPLPAQRLEAAFGLTQAEARLATLLAAGEDLRGAAEKLKITYGTARTRLVQIFQKTGTRRQGELIRLLLTTVVTG